MSVAGTVLEGVDEPVYVGRFEMSLSVPAADDQELSRLRRRHEARMEKQLAPQARFRLNAFFGRWKLLLALRTPMLFTVDFGEDGKFASVGTDEVRVAGTWGVYDSTILAVEKSRPVYMAQLGTHVWLHIDRKKCVGLTSVQQSFRLWGKPDISSPIAELQAKSEAGSSHADRVLGYCYWGVLEPCLWGRFTLERDHDSE
eukprot:gnl/TRDRNA2_/TRDRNA2_169554_c0_seq9.p1 gnl/TRDRNA2_/TRDRNA2_169554_c0~~gnl/TRDRNA2_/TRDRNA2_169554_c0_seq9.p1  ORF type:complete len:200 (+),score=17.84 gnl/TRDRNA2_/TRDRNA2_169554_c0_seq9:208-807(+)